MVIGFLASLYNRLVNRYNMVVNIIWLNIVISMSFYILGRKKEVEDILVYNTCNTYVYARREAIIAAKDAFKYDDTGISADELVMPKGKDITDDATIYIICMYTIPNTALRERVVKKATKLARHKIAGYINGITQSIVQMGD